MEPDKGRFYPVVVVEQDAGAESTLRDSTTSFRPEAPGYEWSTVAMVAVVCLFLFLSLRALLRPFYS